MKKLAVIGTGIAGMSAAYFLHQDYELTVFEKNDYVGGHTNTIYAHDGEKECPMDTGFMVFNEETYPLLVKLFKELKVEYKDTDMGFAVDHGPSGLQYNGSNMAGLFIQKKNIFKIRFLKMLADIMKFNKTSIKMLQDGSFENITIREHINKYKLGNDFLERFLIPMSSAVWSTPAHKMLDFPAKTLAQFFYNHGFLGVDTQFQWKTPVNGSQQYREKIIAPYQKNIQHEAVQEVSQEGEQVKVKTDLETYYFDKVIIAAHGDQALKILKSPTDLQRQALGPVQYQDNHVYVHSDASVMPGIKKNWRSWNYITRRDEKGEEKSFTVYWMNSLQGVSDKKNFFVNVNGTEFVDKSKVIKEIKYEHPIFTKESIKAQELFEDLNKEGPIYFCGAYWRYGFHEDGLLSTVNLLKCGFNKEVLSS